MNDDDTPRHVTNGQLYRAIDDFSKLVDAKLDVVLLRINVLEEARRIRQRFWIPVIPAVVAAAVSSLIVVGFSYWR